MKQNEKFNIISNLSKKDYQYYMARWNGLSMPSSSLAYVFFLWCLFLSGGSLTLLIIKEYVTTSLTVLSIFNLLVSVSSVILVVWVVEKFYDYGFFIIETYLCEKWLKEKRDLK